MNGYPANHDARHRQREHDEINQKIDEWAKTHVIEVIPVGSVSKACAEREDYLVGQKWSNKILPIEGAIRDAREIALNETFQKAVRMKTKNPDTEVDDI